MTLETRPPGRPRSAQADEAILQATLELLATDGYRRLTIEAVRERAGVGKATIYRRYGSKEELVSAAIAHLNSDIPLPDDTGSLQGPRSVQREQARSRSRAARWPRPDAMAWRTSKATTAGRPVSGHVTTRGPRSRLAIRSARATSHAAHAQTTAASRTMTIISEVIVVARASAAPGTLGSAW